MRGRWIIFVGLLFISASVSAQDSKKQDSTWTKPKTITPLKPSTVTDSASQVDTIYYVPEQVVSPAENVTNPVDYEEHLTQKPTIALFKSMLVPGWGQLGNRKYVKAAVIIGLEAWLVSETIHYGGQARDERARFEAATDAGERDYYYGLYQDRRAQRNKYTWFSGIVIFASMFDAYVDAHLSGAPDQVKPRKVDVDIKPDSKGGVAAGLSLRF